MIQLESRAALPKRMYRSPTNSEMRSAASGQGSPAAALRFEICHFAAACLVAAVCGCAAKRPASAPEYRELYHTPLLSPGTQFAALPPAVQHTVRAEVGSAELWEVVKDTSSGPAIYRVDFENRDLFPPMSIAADGS